MPERDVEHIDQMLTRADEAGWTSGGVPENDSVRVDWERLRALGVAGATVVRGPEPHLSDEALAQLVAERRAKGEGWRLPEHLWDCPQCLEAFDVLLSNPAPADAGALARFDALWRPLRHGVLAKIGGLLPRRGWAAVAAALVLAFSMSMVVYATRPLVRIGSGDLVLADGKVLEQGDALPTATALIAREAASAAFRDGSKLGIDRGSRFMVSQPPEGGIFIVLEQGGLDASVTKRRPGEVFCVATSLSRVEVVGTRFRVALLTKRAEAEPGTITGAAPDEHIVGEQVIVREGVVRVLSRSQQVSLTAGQTADILADSGRIVVSDTAKP